ncbi:MAG: hypothetical protein D6732_25445 [Methanobacteriota archaeon]|nr:MAG: hypothetical protein D6732_25445 [Euryarchaeota archaeon]
METISKEIIENVWEEIGKMPPEEMGSLIEEFGKTQKGVLTYLLTTGESLIPTEEREWLFFLGIMIWRIMSKVNNNLSSVPLEDIYAAEDANYSRLENLSEESEGDFIAQSFEDFNSYNQKHLLGVIVEAVLGKEEESFFDEEEAEHKGFMLLVLKTIIDCFDQAE